MNVKRRLVHCEICDETKQGTQVHTHPPFVICDECLAEMDETLAGEVLELEKALQEEKC